MKPTSQTLTVLVPSDAEVRLVPSLDPKCPDRIAGTRKEKGGKAAWNYPDLPEGNYRILVSGNGYYTTDQTLFWSAERRKTGLVLPGVAQKRGGREWEERIESVRFLEPAVMEKIAPSDPAQWPDLAEVFTTPSFDPSLAPHEIAHQDAFRAYLVKEVSACPRAYLFSMGKSGKWGYDLPMVLFTETDLSGVKTPEEAAEKLRGDGKVKVHYQAQIHGNEPAAGEGALAQIHALCGEKGKRLLSRMDLYVFPRVNPDGARAFTRNEVAKKANLNRDMFTARCAEVQALHRAVRAFCPEVVFDAHEYTFKSEKETAPFNDILMSIGGGVNNGAETRRVSEEMMLRAIGALKEKGLRGFAYNNVDTPKKGYTTNSTNPTTGRLYRSLGGALSFLIESRGIRLGKNFFHRRVAAQFVAVSDLLESVYERAEEICAVIAAERKDLTERGAKPDASRPFVLRSETSHAPGTCVLIPQPTFDYRTGAFADKDQVSEVFRIDTAVRSRPLPRAYLVPRGRKWEKQVRGQLELLGIEYTLLPAGTKKTLCRYRLKGEEAVLDKKAPVTFPKGAVRVDLAQPNLLYAAYLFEPDVGDAREGATSFVQTGVITPDADGALPLYREA